MRGWGKTRTLPHFSAQFAIFKRAMFFSDSNSTKDLKKIEEGVFVCSCLNSASLVSQTHK